MGPRERREDKEKEDSIAKKSLQSLLTFHPLALLLVDGGKLDFPSDLEIDSI